MPDPIAPKTSATLLEVEDEDARQLRIERLLQAQSSSTSSATKPLIPLAERSRPHFVQPPTDLLARLEAFLPTMKKANEELEQKIAKEGQASVDIEKLGDEVDSAPGDDELGESDNYEEPQPKKPYIEMNLGLGVFETRPGETSAQTKQALVEEVESSDSSASSSSDSEDDVSMKTVSQSATSRKQ